MRHGRINKNNNSYRFKTRNKLNIRKSFSKFKDDDSHNIFKKNRANHDYVNKKLKFLNIIIPNF